MKRNGRPIINVFEVNEELYFRCKHEDLENPYKAITIAELSHNRAGLASNVLSEPEDVLYNITDQPFRKYSDLVVCTLRIVSLNPDNTYRKTFSQTKNQEQYNAVMELIHDPDNCMYPHSVFRVWLNNQIVTLKNSNQTLSKVQKIRSALKNEIASMIWQRVVDQNSTSSSIKL